MRYRTLILASMILAGTLVTTAIAAPYNDGPARQSNIRKQGLSRTQISGTIESINGNRANIITEDGQQYGVALGPKSFWGPRGGRYLQPGAQVTVDAWGDPYNRSDWYFAGSIWGDGFSVNFTNDYGVPYWEDYDYSDNWWPTYGLFAGWYSCGPYVYDYVLPPPPPFVYYRWYPYGYYPMHYRHFYRGYDYGQHDRGWHRGWDRGNRDHGNYRERDGRRDDGRQGSGDYRGGPRGDSGQTPTPPRNPSYRGGPRGR